MLGYSHSLAQGRVVSGGGTVAKIAGIRISGVLVEPSYGPILHAKGKVPLLLDFNPTDRIGIAEVMLDGTVSVELSEEQYRRIGGEAWSFEVIKAINRTSTELWLSLVRVSEIGVREVV